MDASWLPLLALMLPLASDVNLPPADPMQNDARLADVCFVDADFGWVVGDRGTIWHTQDGGRHWEIQNSGVACPLQSVCFVDRKNGWAAGGFAHPYTHTGAGVVLVTTDGGRQWRHEPRALLPPLKRLQFLDHQHGWAIGTPSAMYPSGVLVSDSGGRGWAPMPGPMLAPWLAGDCLDPHTGALAGRRGMAAVVQRGGIAASHSGPFGLRNLSQLRLVAPVHGWLAGDGGLVMLTGDLGANWQTPSGELPPGTAQQFDFLALAVRGPKCWVAGSPGTRIFHTPDAGRTWLAFPTGTSVPIEAICFSDELRGWAVGALGTILSTTDGGRTWQRQRCGGTRAALLALVSQIEDVPLELLAKLSGNEGYLGVAEVLNRRDVEVSRPSRVPPFDRLREAVVAVGGSDARLAWRFPVRQAGLDLDARQILGGWDRANDGRGILGLQSHIVRQIRLWRPDVIVTHDADPQAAEPLAHLVHQAVLQAAPRAADPTSFADQITQAGLEPWQVKRVYAWLPPAARGSIELPTAQLAPRLGSALADVAAGPRGLLGEQFQSVPPVLGFRLLWDNLPGEQGQRDFFSAIVLQPGGDARRMLLEPPTQHLDLLRRTAAQRRNMQAILERTEQDPQRGAQLLAQAGDLTRQLEPDAAGRILYHLAQRYHRTGQWPLAAETLELLAQRYPDHPMYRPAAVWLVQYYAADETAWRVHGGQRVTDARGSAPALDVSRQEDRPSRAAGLGKELERTRPELFAEPAIRFPLCVAWRKQGYPRQAERFYLAASRSPNRDAWCACAQGELWLAEPKGVAPKPVLACVQAPAKPRLNGRLDDPVWRSGRPTPLASALKDDADWPATVMLAYDSEFLYVALHCRRAPGTTYPASQGPRPRDGDMAGHDRVELLLDLDRDYATYYRLAIDHRGWTGESCWGDSTWNPTWFVAPGSDGEAWTAEAAIALDQLTGRYPAPRDVWAVGVQRIVPGAGMQSASAPAAAAGLPEGFAYLVFQ